MIRNAVAVCVTAGLLAGGTAAQTTSGRITNDETWSGTVTVTGDIEVMDATVTIEPGTRVQFNKGQDTTTVVNGSQAQICLILRDGAGFSAVGTEAQPVLFTSAEASPAAGDWCEIDIAGVVDTPVTRFEHCVFEYGRNALDFRSGQTSGEWASIELDNPIVIQYCTVRHMDACGIYITSGGEPDILHCTFHDLNSCAVFPHGAKTVDIEFCTIYDVSVGIISPGEDWWDAPQRVYCINNTIDNVDYDKTDSPKWWTGYGIWCGNTRGTLYLRNTIISNTTNAGVTLGGWGLSKRNNCYYETGDEPIEGGTSIASSSIEADPLYTDAASGDYSLQSVSPCIGTGYGGVDMGAWQSTAAVRLGGTETPAAGLSLSRNPVETGGSVELAGTMEGEAVGRVFSATGTLEQEFVMTDGRARLAPVAETGVHIVRVNGCAVRLLVK